MGEPEGWGDIVHNTIHVGEVGLLVGGLLKGYYITQIAGRVVGNAVYAATVAEALFLNFFVLAIYGNGREAVFFEEAAQSAANRLSRELRESGLVEEAIDLFMAVCNQNDHGVTEDDELTQQGWWHGLVYLDFDQALQEGRAHGHPDGTRVLRFQTSTPDVVEIIEIESA
jgi:hypothetical protein